MNDQLEKYLAKAADDLPAMPAIAQEIVKSVDDPNSSIAHLKNLVEQDSALAAKLLKMSNSSLYGFPSEIRSIAHALSLLGLCSLASPVQARFCNAGIGASAISRRSSRVGRVRAGIVGARAGPPNFLEL